uniref:phosphoenolpyruvate hydrolase family protein n=1 Tax=Bradyrhizobium diazoefficiens TaxID=1355477 RepID=UPI0036F398AA
MSQARTMPRRWQPREPTALSHMSAQRAAGLWVMRRGQSIEEAIRRINEINAAAQAVRPEVILLCHGGAIAEPQDTSEVYRSTGCVGFVGASSIERIPIERAVKAAAEEFKAVPLPRKRQQSMQKSAPRHE